MPPLPVIIFFSVARSYFPEVASSTRLQLGSEPARSGAKGPSPLRALLTSTTLPSHVGADRDAAAQVGDDQPALS